MTNSSARSTAPAIERSRRRSWRGFFASAALLLSLLVPLAPASAATTCGAGTAEAGGTHTRCVSGAGVFHVWTPSGYDATKPGFVAVFVHGYSDQCGRPSNLDGSDGVSDTWFSTPGSVYIDAYWSALGLGSQFAQGATGAMSNTLFVAPQSPTCSTSSSALHTDSATRWSALGSLLTDIDAGGIRRPTGPVILIGHSGAYTTLSNWQSDPSVSYVAYLDTFYVDSGFSSWLSPAQPKHAATIVLTADELGKAGGTPGANHEAASTGILSGITDKVSLTSAPSSAASMDAAAQKARVVSIETSGLSHMHLVMPGGVIPMVVQRAATAGTAAATPPPAPSPAPTGSAGTASGGTTTLKAPVLEVPIPNVSFSDAIVNNGTVTIPFLAQYIGGIYAFLIGIIGMVAAVMMIIGGFQYITSAGDSGKLGDAKKRIVDAIIGVVLAFGSYIILYTINPSLVSFQALQLTTVSTIQYGDQVDGVSPPPPPGTPPAPPVSGNIDITKRICSSVADCLPYCRAAGCTSIATYNRKDYMPATLPGFDGVTFKNISNPFSNDCNQTSFPNIPGAARIPIPSMPHVRPNGNSASQQVIDGLNRASQYIDQHYPGQNITINVSNCYRDARADFGAQCAIIMRATNNDPSTQDNGSTWPGANPHSSGYACDLGLLENGQQTSCTAIGYSQYQCQFKSGDDKLVEILTNPTVGGKRLTYECWHFEFGSPYGSRCQGSDCNALDSSARSRLKISC